MIECLNPAYDRIVNSGIVKKIADKREVVRDILLGIDLGVEAYKIFEEVEKAYEKVVKGKISESEKLYESILEFQMKAQESMEGFGEKENLLIQHPSLLAFAVLGQDILRFQEFGFPSRKSLEESLTSFCLGERHEIYRNLDDYIWRNEKFKNIISNSHHGDLYFGQINISGRDAKILTLFGPEEEFDVFRKDSQRKNANAHHDCWGHFLGAALKYAEVIGKTGIPEIKNWEETMSQVGSKPTFTAEAEFGESGHEILLADLMDREIIMEGKEMTSSPIYIIGERYHYPYVSKDGKLLFWYAHK